MMLQAKEAEGKHDHDDHHRNRHCLGCLYDCQKVLSSGGTVNGRHDPAAGSVPI